MAGYEIIPWCFFCEARDVPGVHSRDVRQQPADYCQVCWEMSLAPLHANSAKLSEYYLGIALSKLARRLLYDKEAP